MLRYLHFPYYTQVVTCSKLTRKTLEQGAQYFQSEKPCSTVSIVNFEQVNAGWVQSQLKTNI